MPTVRLMIVCVIGACLIAASGCRSVDVSAEDRPAYRHEPHPSERGGGPPPWAPAHGYRAKHHYHYYPLSGIYYDSGRALYFYYANGKWQAAVSLPSSIHIKVGDYVTLQMDTDEPYRYHSDVVKRYPPGQQKKMLKGKGKNKWN